MAKLLGKADSTITAAALKAGMADVMPDYSELYKQKAENLKENYETFQTTIENFFDGLTAETSALGDELKEAVTTTMADLSTGSTPDEQGIELFDSYFNELKQKLKTTKVGKEGEVERAKIRAEMNRVKNSTSGMAETLIDLGVRIENGDFNANAMGKDRLDVLKAINDKTAKREIVNGNLVYSMPGSDKKITQDDLRKILVSNDPEVSKAVNNVTVGALTTGKIYGTEWQKERQAVVNDYKEGFTTKEALSFEMHKPQGNLKYSWAEYLAGKGDKKYNMQIWASLRDAGLEGIPEDKNGDGKITELDFANAENGIAMIKRLTQISEDGFNLGITKQVYSEFLADTVAKKEFDDGKTLLNRSQRKGNVIEEKGTGFLATKKGVNSGSLGYYVFPDYNSAKFAYDQFNLASKGEKAKFSIGKAQYVFDVEGDNAYKWIEKTAGGGQKVLGKTTETIGPDGFGITDPDFLKINNFGGSIEEFEGLSSKKNRPDDLKDTQLSLNVEDMSLSESGLIGKLNNLLPDIYSTDKGYNFQTAKTGRDGQGFNKFGDIIGLYDKAGIAVRYPYDYKIKSLRRQFVTFKTGGETAAEREEMFRDMIKTLEGIGVYETMSVPTGKLLDEK